MYRVLSVVVATALLAGCSSKEQELSAAKYEKNKDYHKQLGKTESSELKDGLASRAVFTATYLYTPSKDKNDSRDEKFIVNLYFNDEEVSYEANDFNITLNKKLPKQIKKLNYNDPLLHNISLVSEWSQFYLLTFAHEKNKKLELKLESEVYGHATLEFAKVAKYVFTKEVL